LDAKPFIEIATTNPAFEESAMFDRMVDYILKEGESFDRVIFDTAAVANAVRLIGLSKIYGLWLTRMIDSRKEALSMRVQLSFVRRRCWTRRSGVPRRTSCFRMTSSSRRERTLYWNTKGCAYC